MTKATTYSSPQSSANPSPQSSVRSSASSSAQASVTDQEILKRFWSYLRPHWKWVALAALSIPFSVGSTLFIPWMIINIVDGPLTEGDLQGLFTMVTLTGVAIAGGYIADSFYTFSLQRSGHLTIYEMRKDLYSHLLSLPRTFFDKRPVGVILTRITSDMEALGESMAAGVLSVFTDLLKTLGLLILLLSISWKLTLILLFLLPAVYVTANLLRRKLRYYYNQTREALAEATGYLQECMSGIKTIQLYAAEAKVHRSFEQKTKKFFQAQSWSNFYDASLFSIIEGITSVSLALMVWYGSGQILAGTVTLGVLVGFINTLHRIFVPIREFTQQITVFQRALSSLENIERLFQESPESHETAALTPEQEETLQNFEELCFENVSFRYQEENPWVLKNISFTIRRGERVALVGSTGSGKSTLIRVLTRTYTGYHGSIRLNGIELSLIPRTVLQRMMAMMQQDNYLFEETVAFNIGLNRESVSQEMVEQAAKYVYADSFIEQFPDQYQYPLLAEGKNLSAGQGRLLVFARAIAGKSDMIIMDEATSSVDSVTESLIQKAIERIFEEKTVIAIAHRLSTIRHSDLILVLSDGEVLERGTHDTLLEKQGFYAGLLEKL